MIYNMCSPKQELQDIVKQYIVVSSLDGIDDLLFLPNGCNFIVFNRGIDGYTQTYTKNDKFPIPKNYSVSVKVNKIKKFTLKESHDSKSVKFPIILAELTPIGFYKLFNKDAFLLNESYLELDDEVVEKYFKNLYKHKSLEEELDYLDNSLDSLYNSQNNVHMPIQDVIEKIVNSYHFEVSVDSLVQEFNCSRSTMERNFKKIVGLTPKNFIFISKFCKTVLAVIEDGCSFKELQYLYSDSSHLNAVFKKFFGLNPSEIINYVENNKMRIYQMQKNKK